MPEIRAAEICMRVSKRSHSGLGETYIDSVDQGNGIKGSENGQESPVNFADELLLFFGII